MTPMDMTLTATNLSHGAMTGHLKGHVVVTAMHHAVTPTTTEAHPTLLAVEDLRTFTIPTTIPLTITTLTITLRHTILTASRTILAAVAWAAMLQGMESWGLSIGEYSLHVGVPQRYVCSTVELSL